MVVYSIRDLEKICGIKAHTLRIWEKRYDLLVAQRTATNIRYYTEEDLKFALNLSILYRNGCKISKLAKFTKEEIRSQVAEITEIDNSFEKSLDTLSIAMLELDEYKFVHILDKNISQKGFDSTMETVIYPLLEKINLMWVASSINEVHEQFVLNIIKQKIIVEIDKLPIARNSEPNSFMLYLPENESQKLSLYYMFYMLRSRNFPVFFLGEEVSYNKLKSAVSLMKTDYIFTIINESFSEKPLQPYIDKIAAEFDATLILSGYQALNQSVVASDKCKILSTLNHVLEFTDKLNKSKLITNS